MSLGLEGRAGKFCVPIAGGLTVALEVLDGLEDTTGLTLLIASTLVLDMGDPL